MKLKCLLALLLAFGLCMAVSTANAAVIANFDDANGSGVDTYPGVAGDGWANAWQAAAVSASTYKAIKLPSTTYPEFNGPGDPFMLLKTTATASNGGRASLNRDYSGSGGIDLNEDYTISFSVRPHDVAGMNSANDVYAIFGCDTSAAYYSDGDATFVIKACKNAATNPEWYFLDYETPGGSVAGIYSGIFLEESHIYDFEVVMHPATLSYDISLTDRAVPSVTFSALDLGWRRSVHGTNLTFSTRCSAKNDLQMVTFDNIAIANMVEVPEPSTLVLLASALIGLLIWRRK